MFSEDFREMVHVYITELSVVEGGQHMEKPHICVIEKALLFVV